MHANGSKINIGMFLLKSHASLKVRETKKQTRPQDGKCVGGIEREEPNSWNTLHMHLRAHVELMRLAQNRERGNESGANAPHCEWCHAHPGCAFEGVEAQPRGDQRSQKICRNGEMQKEQLIPCLGHDRPARWPCPD